MSHDQVNMGDTGMDIFCWLSLSLPIGLRIAEFIYNCLIQVKIGRAIRDLSSEFRIETKKLESSSGKSPGQLVPPGGQGTYREE